jgi:hypothetical protein
MRKTKGTLGKGITEDKSKSQKGSPVVGRSSETLRDRAVSNMKAFKSSKKH